MAAIKRPSPSLPRQQVIVSGAQAYHLVIFVCSQPFRVVQSRGMRNKRYRSADRRCIALLAPAANSFYGSNFRWRQSARRQSGPNSEYFESLHGSLHFRRPVAIYSSFMALVFMDIHVAARIFVNSSKPSDLPLSAFSSHFKVLLIGSALFIVFRSARQTIELNTCNEERYSKRNRGSIGLFTLSAHFLLL